MEKIKCACGCGKELDPFDSRGRPRKFLPSHWSRIQPSAQVLVACENCGKEFYRPRWHLKKVKHNFCGQGCEGEWSSKTGRRKGKCNGHYNTVTVPCYACGKPISKAKSLVERRNGHVYCEDCVPIPRQGRKGPYIGYPSEFNASLRHRIRRRDDFTCQVCGKHQDRVGTLHVHHIDYDRHNNVPINLVSLCRACHGQTNFGQATWTHKLQSIMRLRFNA